MELLKVLEKRIKPRAELIDTSPRALLKGFKILGRKKLLAQTTTKEEYFAFTELIQSYSGALGFFQRQHQAAGRIFSQSEKKRFQEEWYPLMLKGKRRVGVSISHLRAPDAPCVKAARVEGGWSLTGVVPWVSGYRLFDWLIMGFFCPEEKIEGMGLISFKKSSKLKVPKALNMIALNSTQTLSVELKGLFLKESDVISLNPIGTFNEASNAIDVQFVNLSALALGFLRGLDEPSLQAEYEACRNAFLEKGADVALYAEMNRIATQLSHIARFSSGTCGVICPNEVERRCRELMLFSVILPSHEIVEACLAHLYKNVTSPVSKS